MLNETLLQSYLDDDTRNTIDWKSRGETNGNFIVRRKTVLELSNSVIVGTNSAAFIVEPNAELFIYGGHITTNLRDSKCIIPGSSSPWRPGVTLVVKKGGLVKVENVDLIGDIAGFSDFSGEWHLPTVLSLPNIAPRSRVAFCVKGFIPYETNVESEIYGVGVSSSKLGPGSVSFTIDIDATEAENGVFIDGWIRFSKDGLIHRIRMRTRVVTNAPHDPKNQNIVWESPAFSKPPVLSGTTVINPLSGLPLQNVIIPGQQTNFSGHGTGKLSSIWKNKSTPIIGTPILPNPSLPIINVQKEIPPEVQKPSKKNENSSGNQNRTEFGLSRIFKSTATTSVPVSRNNASGNRKITSTPTPPPTPNSIPIPTPTPSPSPSPIEDLLSKSPLSQPNSGDIDTVQQRSVPKISPIFRKRDKT